MLPTSHLCCIFSGLAIFLGSCASPLPYSSAGVQDEEAIILKQHFYWSRSRDPRQFKDEEVREIFVRTLHVEIGDGEKSELLSARLVLMLAVIGDEHFAALLRREPLNVRHRVLARLETLWMNDNLHYPLTEAVSC